MYKSQLEPPSENFHETQVFVENIFDTVKKAREAKTARSLAESKLASYDYSFDFSPSKRKKTRKNAKNKKNLKTVKTTPKKKPRKNAKTPKDGSSEKKKKTTPTKTPRKYTKRAKVKPQNDIDDEEAAFILSSISQRSFDSFYNRFNGNSIQIPLETPQTSPPICNRPRQPTPVSTQNSAYHVLLDHNYWIAEPEITKPEPKPDAMNLLSTVAESILSPSKVEPTTSSTTVTTTTNMVKPLEVNNNKLPLLDVNCDTPKCDNAVKKRWLRQATSENTSPVLAVTPPETSPDDLKAPLKKRRMAREIDEYWADQQHKDEIKKCETESDQKVKQDEVEVLNLVKNSDKKEIDQNHEVAVDLSNVNRVVRSSIIVDGRNYSNGFSINNIVKTPETKFEPRALNFDANSSILAQSLTTLPSNPSILPQPVSYDPKSSFFGLVPTAYNPTQINFDKLIKFEEKSPQHQLADQNVNKENAQLLKETAIPVMGLHPLVPQHLLASPIITPPINLPNIEVSPVKSNHTIKSPTKVKQSAKKKEKKVKQVKPKKPKKVRQPKVKKPPKVKQPKISKAKQNKVEKKQNEKLKKVLKSQEVRDLIVEPHPIVINEINHEDTVLNSVIQEIPNNFDKNSKVDIKESIDDTKNLIVDEVKSSIKEEVNNIIKPLVEEVQKKVEEEIKNVETVDVKTEIKNEENYFELKTDVAIKQEPENEFIEAKQEEILNEKIEDEIDDFEHEAKNEISEKNLELQTKDNEEEIEESKIKCEKVLYGKTEQNQDDEKLVDDENIAELEKYEPEKVTNDDEYSLDSIKSFDSIELKTVEEPAKPADPVVSQVASILEKVIPKTLKPDIIEQIEDPVEDDEDDSQNWEIVEKFHKDVIEKLMLANRRFCNNSIIQNPFKTETESHRHSRFDKPLKASLSFESHHAPSLHPPHFQRSVSEVLNDPRKDRLNNGFYERRDSYGSFHYDKIHHREPITTTYSMYRAQKAAQIDHRWNNNSVWTPPPQVEPPKVINNFTPVTVTTPATPQSPPRVVLPEVIRPIPAAVDVSTATVPVTPTEPFGTFLKEKLTSSTSLLLPAAKTSSHDPRLNPLLIVDTKKEELSTPKKKVNLV